MEVTCSSETPVPTYQSTRPKWLQLYFAVCTYLCIIYFPLIKITWICKKKYPVQSTEIGYSCQWCSLSPQRVHFQLIIAVNLTLCNAVCAAELTCCKAGGGGGYWCFRDVRQFLDVQPLQEEIKQSARAVLLATLQSETFQGKDIWRLDMLSVTSVSEHFVCSMSGNKET
jgi:hypothetical protein